jgi:hypothetical protein
MPSYLLTTKADEGSAPRHPVGRAAVRQRIHTPESAVSLLYAAVPVVGGIC